MAARKDYLERKRREAEKEKQREKEFLRNLKKLEVEPVGKRHLFVPDTQCKPGVPLEHLTWLGEYIARKLPDVIVLAGDHYDMPSLSSYDKGKKSAENRRYQKDIDAGTRGLDLIEEVIAQKTRNYRPRKIVTLGNHEERILRYVEDHAELEDKVSLKDTGFESRGWEVHEFLKPVVVDGISYIHYCPLNAQGRVSSNAKNGAPSAQAQGQRMKSSTVCGHRQGYEQAAIHTPSRTIRSVIAGSFYQHQEKYLTPIGENYWRGILVFNDVHDGEFDICEVSMNYLKRRYG